MWGNPPVHIVSRFNLIAFWWGDPSRRVVQSARPGNPLSLGQIFPCKRFKVG